MQRIHIMGAAGSGKTTLAGQVASLLDVHWHELDAIAYEGGFARKRTLDERLASLQAIVAQPSWVTEGFYLWWIDDLLQAADVIVWLDLPWFISLHRIITRHIKLSLAGKNRHPGVLKLLGFAWGCRTYYLEKTPNIPQAPDQDFGVNRAGVLDYLAPYAYKVVQCRGPADVKTFLAGLDREG